MKKTTTRIGCAFACLALVGLVSCGDDSSSGGGGDLTAEEQEYVDAMMTSLKADETAPFSDEEGQCLAEGMVKAVGVDSLKEAGITPADIGGDGDVVFGDLPKEKTDQLVSLFFEGECFDFGALMASAIAQDPSVSIPGEKAECIGDKMSESDEFKQAFVASVTGDDSVDPFESVGDIFQIFADCDIDLADLGG
jgi:hypothetical protein